MLNEIVPSSFCVDTNVLLLSTAFLLSIITNLSPQSLMIFNSCICCFFNISVYNELTSEISSTVFSNTSVFLTHILVSVIKIICF